MRHQRFIVLLAVGIVVLALGVLLRQTDFTTLDAKRTAALRQSLVTDGTIRTLFIAGSSSGLWAIRENGDAEAVALLGEHVVATVWQGTKVIAATKAGHVYILTLDQVETGSIQPVWQGTPTSVHLTAGGNNAFIGDASGKVFLSVNGGLSWTLAFEFPKTTTSSPVTTLSSDRDELVLAGYGTMLVASLARDGVTWTQLQPGEQSPQSVWCGSIHQVYADPLVPRRVFVLTAPCDDTGVGHRSGLYVTYNGGSHWERVAKGLDGAVQLDRIVANPQQRNEFLLAGHDPHGEAALYYSHDGGRSWRDVTRHTALAVVWFERGYAWAIAREGEGLWKVYVTAYPAYPHTWRTFAGLKEGTNFTAVAIPM